MDTDRRFYADQQGIAAVLLAWGVGSIAAGAALLTRPVPYRDIGLQWVIWGAIDAALAVFGWLGARAKQRDASISADRVQKDARTLLVIFAVNSVLDVLYLVVAGRFALTRRYHGHGVGAFVQALFLLIFDGFHAARLARRG